MKKYYLAHKKVTIRSFLKVLGQSTLLQGEIIEVLRKF